MSLNDWVVAMGLLFAIIGFAALVGLYIGHFCFSAQFSAEAAQVQRGCGIAPLSGARNLQ
jgi:hypothetical protein